MEENKDNKCKACGQNIDVNADFCPYCKFPQFVLPAAVSEEVLEFEKERVSLYKSVIKSAESSLNNLFLIGYLIVMQDEDYQQVFPVYKGVNVFGKNPRYVKGVFRNIIEMDCEDLRNENFSLETDQKGFVVAKLIEGIWSIGYWGNSPLERILSNGDSILINDLKFIFIAK